MGLKNILIVVSDIEKSRRFYHEVFGLNIVKDFGENVMLTEGLVLQEQKARSQNRAEPLSIGNASELFFEEVSLATVLAKLEKSGLGELIEGPYENPFGKEAAMLKDPDGHLIEVAEK